MRIRRRSARVEALVCLALLALPARAVITGGGNLAYRVDHAEVVVKARVVAHGEYGAEDVSFVIEPVQVLKGSGTAVPERIPVDIPWPVWPSEPLGYPYREGAVALFFLEERGGRLNATNNLYAILPAMEAQAAESASGASLSRKIYEELARFVPAAASDSARARLLVLLAQVATKADTDLFTPYLRSDSPLERRGALAALLRLDPTAERVEQARRDLEAFYSAPQDPSKEWVFWDLYREVLDQRHAYAGSAASATIGLLPLYRALADTLALLPADRQPLSADRAALGGLVRAGRREDARRLSRYAGSRDAYLRHEALGALGRMLGIPGERPQVTSYLMPLEPSVLEWERRMQEAVRQALEREP